jgi:hypothetical protein
MSLHFSLRPLPSGRVLRLVDGAHACAAAGLALAALQLASAAAHGAAALSLAGLPPVALAWRAARRAVSRSGRLEVDARGAAAWQAAGEPAMPLRPVRWLVFGGVVWIRARVGGRRLDLLSGRDAHPDADWRGLMRWLRWLDRGAAAAGDLESRPGATT